MPSLVLHKLPTDALDTICKALNDIDHDALMHLALAAPPFFAPAIYAIFDFRGAWNPNTPAGARNRAPFTQRPGQKLNLRMLSRKWTLLPIPFEELRYAIITSPQTWFVPPQCYTVISQGCLKGAPEKQVHPIPDTLRNVTIDTWVMSDDGVRGCDQVARVLPATLDKLQLIVYRCCGHHHDEDEDEDDHDHNHDYDDLSKELVQLTLPSVARDLMISLLIWSPNMPHTLILPPLLTSLGLFCNMKSVSVLHEIVSRLLLWGMATESRSGMLAHLAHNIPPHLAVLTLWYNRISDLDLADLAGLWPTTLTHLYLSENLLEFAKPVLWPARLFVLDLAGNHLMEELAGDWLETLPSTVRSLDLSRTHAVAGMVDPLLQHLAPKSSVVRIEVGVWQEMLLPLAKERLKAAFFLDE
ncbi:hypothetical protein GGF32_006732 [Allomyces javanicus]|nr:hypothetical protein GGF32_006732 [Allomyces javanicus]